MALKRKITKAEHAALNSALQAEYKADGENFVLDAEGFDDPGELRRALERVRTEKDAAEAKAKVAEDKLKTIDDDKLRATGDVAALEKSYKTKLDEKDLAHRAELDKINKHLQTTLVDKVASQLASELGGSNAAILLPHIKSRLSADMTGETPLTRVLDKEGKPSADSVEDLKKEFSANPTFKSVIVASKGSGGGAAGSGAGNGSGAPTGKKFRELNDVERTALYKENPAEFKKQSDAAKAEEYATRVSPSAPAVRSVA